MKETKMSSGVGVMDQPRSSVEKVRYSDEDLAMFRESIMGKLAIARFDYNNLKKTPGDGGGDQGFLRLDESQKTVSDDENQTLATRQKKFIDYLEAALVRIENKTYGVCRCTKKLIPIRRLLAVPHATLCVEAKN
jgi:DnaK suppressor protein